MEHGALTISGIKIKGLVYSLFYKFGEDWSYLKNYEKNSVKKNVLSKFPTFSKSLGYHMIIKSG